MNGSEFTVVWEFGFVDKVSEVSLGLSVLVVLEGIGLVSGVVIASSTGVAFAAVLRFALILCSCSGSRLDNRLCSVIVIAGLVTDLPLGRLVLAVDSTSSVLRLEF